MSPEVESSLQSARLQPSADWLHARALWAGLSIITMWLAVLFLGLFGGNILSSTPGATTTSVPVVVAVIPFVLPATIVVARRGFTEVRDGRQGRVTRETPAAQGSTAEPRELRTKLA